MSVKNSLALFVNNINLSFKAMLYRLVVVVVCTAIMYLIVNLNLRIIVNSWAMNDFIEAIKEMVANFTKVELSTLGQNLSDRYRALMGFIGEHIGSVIGSVIGVIIMVWVENFFLGLSHSAITKVVDAHMSSLTKLGFMEALFVSLKTAALFEAIYSLIKMLIVAFTIILCMVFVVFTIEYLTIFSLVIAVWLLILLISLFLNATALFRPSVINGVGVRASFKMKVSKKQYWTNLASFIVMFTVAIVINVITFSTTFGAGLMISLPISALYFACLKLVIYYNANNRKYYIDIDNIVTPVILREDGELLDNVDVE